MKIIQIWVCNIEIRHIKMIFQAGSDVSVVILMVYVNARLPPHPWELLSVSMMLIIMMNRFIGCVHQKCKFTLKILDCCLEFRVPRTYDAGVKV